MVNPVGWRRLQCSVLEGVAQILSSSLSDSRGEHGAYYGVLDWQGHVRTALAHAGVVCSAPAHAGADETEEMTAVIPSVRHDGRDSLPMPGAGDQILGAGPLAATVGDVRGRPGSQRVGLEHDEGFRPPSWMKTAL